MGMKIWYRIYLCQASEPNWKEKSSGVREGNGADFFCDLGCTWLIFIWISCITVVKKTVEVLSLLELNALKCLSILTVFAVAHICARQTGSLTWTPCTCATCLASAWHKLQQLTGGRLLVHPVNLQLAIGNMPTMAIRTRQIWLGNQSTYPNCTLIVCS